MMTDIKKLRVDINELHERVDALRTICDIQQGAIELLTMRGDMMSAHIENLIERVAHLENPLYPLRSNEVPCTCGYGGQHEPANPRCNRNQRAEMLAGGEDTLPTPPVTPSVDT